MTVKLIFLFLLSDEEVKKAEREFQSRLLRRKDCCRRCLVAPDSGVHSFSFAIAVVAVVAVVAVAVAVLVIGSPSEKSLALFSSSFSKLRDAIGFVVCRSVVVVVVVVAGIKVV